MFYEFTQNNSGGYFDVDDKVCHRLFIEADSFTEAEYKAEELGCYWNGVDKGIDCPCCGDRWYGASEINLEKLKNYGVRNYTSKSDWLSKYGDYEIVESPIKVTGRFLSDHWYGKISFSTIEEYAQFLADEYGWTTPDTRIYYADGRVKEIFKRA